MSEIPDAIQEKCCKCPQPSYLFGRRVSKLKPDLRIVKKTSYFRPQPSDLFRYRGAILEVNDE